MIVENIDVPEFGWYYFNVERFISGMSVTIIVSTGAPYLDDLGPRLRIQNTESCDPTDMVPVFIDNPEIPEGILSESETDKLIKFIEVNRVVLLRHWADSYDTSYSSVECHSDLVNV